MKNIVTTTILYSLLIIYPMTSIYGQQNMEKAYTKDEIGALIEQEENKNIKIDSVGILAYDGFNDLDFIGIQSAFSNVMGVKTFLIASKKGMIKGVNTYMVEHELSDFKHLDVLIIPGGSDATFKLTKDTTVLNWIRKIDKTSTYTVSVCNGAWILGATGLLKDRHVSTHWYRAQEMMDRYEAHFENKRWVQDGKYWTSAGVSAGMDMGLAMVLAAKGKTYAEFVQLGMEYDPHPPLDRGSVDKANPGIVSLMTELFDQGLGVENIDKSKDL